MQNLHKLTYVILVLMIGTLSLAGRETQQLAAVQNDTQEKAKQKEEEAKKNFPVADYNEPDPLDSSKRALHKQKQKRHNGLGLVSKNPAANTGGGVFLPRGQFDFPALPVAQSDVIVLGEVVEATAHMSEDKTNVYSEFSVRVSALFKGTAFINNSTIVVERIGGFVLYPDGRKLLYRWGTALMPRVGGKFVFFLKNTPAEDLSILTAYELKDGKICPLDWSGQFESYRGVTEADFLTALNHALAQP